ncbi:phosphoglycerate mutase GpmB [Tatumella sp. TA1]|uniref:2,3-diphosphoglycerate-dependent phosphoglycerate mutase GpmB n=1 Tax=Rosenbergiella collisarenosi TaxID=1544695 RepID=UPI0008F8FFBC|nr:2,3-diphosphoglycerate-dependent phosphoglycerate mutase GpmB [Rosenbergiella collisarenosi]MBT0720028.1 2,3-diphosphoglycerate-dependent phosphoglycerate mutase GpmB [Rosenbergiella collisarenosi]QGX90636.1 phosphoglycerate mutase GpmB [Tatumella sp. TA1]
MQQVLLVRHGETLWNTEQRIQGQSDSELTKQGIEQARQTGLRLQHLGITHIISSDLGRTQQTAAIIAESCQCQCVIDARLREINMGVLEGRALSSLTQQEEQWRKSLLNGDPAGRIPQGESMGELAQRMREALEATRSLPTGSRPVLISHGIALGCLLGTLLGLPAWAERRLRLRNCSVSRVDYQSSSWLAEGWIVESTGDIAHLSAPALDELKA